jgi:hypothetical protein
MAISTVLANCKRPICVDDFIGTILAATRTNVEHDVCSPPQAPNGVIMSSRNVRIILLLAVLLASNSYRSAAFCEEIQVTRTKLSGWGAPSGQPFQDPGMKISGSSAFWRGAPFQDPRNQDIPWTYKHAYPRNSMELQELHQSPLLLTKMVTYFLRRCPQPPWPVVLFPFRPGHPVQCSQGSRTPLEANSHFFEKDLFALDLHSPPGSPPGEIYAAFDGIAYVSQQCSEMRNGVLATKNYTAPNMCGCGGLGNNIRIWNSGGLFATYQHLSRIYVKDGQLVKKGELIGLEGISGNTDHRHLHFQISAANSIDDLLCKQNLSKVTNYGGTELPFFMWLRYSDRTIPELVSSMDIRICNETHNFLIYGSLDGPSIYGVWDNPPGN